MLVGSKAIKRCKAETMTGYGSHVKGFAVVSTDDKKSLDIVSR